MAFDLTMFIDRCRDAFHHEQKNAILRIFNDVMDDSSSIAEVLPASGEDEILLFHSPDLTIYRVLIKHGLQYPPHEHGMAAIIGVYAGCETNYLYVRSKDDPSRVVQTGRFSIKAPRVRILEADAIHAVVNLENEPSAAIHVDLGDLHAQERSLWNLDGEEERVFDEEHYFAWARPLAVVGAPSKGLAVRPARIL